MAILKPTKTTTINGVKVNEYLLKNMYPTGGMTHIKGVTIHNTDWISVADGTTPAEQYTRATANGNMADVLVHYYVDDTCAWQNLPHNVHGWHAADGSGDGNMQTIAIECIMSPNYYERDKKSEDNAARLAAGILKQLGLGIDQLYTHQHWYSKKYCPAYILPHWEQFKRKVQSYLGSAPASTTTELYRIRKTWADVASQIGAYTNLDSAKMKCEDGYSVFNSKGEKVYPEDKKPGQSIIHAESVEWIPLKKGDNSQRVEALQHILIGKGFSCGVYGADHDFGAATEAAVMSFQERAKLNKTGIVDAKTWNALLDY